MVRYGESANQTIPEDLHTTAPLRNSIPTSGTSALNRYHTDPLSELRPPTNAALEKTHKFLSKKNKMQPTNLNAVM